MFRIDPTNNSIQPLVKRTFSELGFSERNHLQEWLANYPDAFGEELLIIQKEFSGFGETNERLDLLALDKQGSLVIIENKLDDSGRDVMWQCLKYASYVSSLTKQEIVEIYQQYLSGNSESTSAKEAIVEFLDDGEFEELSLNGQLTQRLFFVAARFRKEVTSTAIWLLQYGVKITCFETSIYQHDGDNLLRVDQIIPTVQEQDFAIRMAEKVKEEVSVRSSAKRRGDIFEDFWAELLPASNMRISTFKSISPGRNHWITAGTGIRSTSYVYAVGKSFVRIELYIDRGPKGADEVSMIYQYLLSKKEEIEAEFGAAIEWREIPSRRASQLKYQRNDVGVYDESNWPEAIKWLVDSMQRFEGAMAEPLKQVAEMLKE